MECDSRREQEVLLSSVESSPREWKHLLSARLRALEEATSDLCWITTSDGHMLAEQASWERFTGQNQAQAAGKGWLEAVHPGDRKLLEITQAQCVQTRRPCNSVCLVRDAEGRYKCLSLRSVPVLNEEEGHVREVLCLGTSLMPGQQSSNKWLSWTGMAHLEALLIDMAHDIIVVSDQSGRILAWNQGATNLYGYSEEEALGWRGPDLFQTHFPNSLSEEAFVQTLLHDGKWEGELEHVCRDGHRVIVEARFVVMRSEDGQPLAVLEVSRDITERKRTEQQLQAYIQLAETAGKIGLWTADLVQDKADLCLLDETIFPVQLNQSCSFEQFLQIIHPDDRAKAGEALRNALEQKRDYVNEFRVLDVEQRIHWYMVYGRAIYDELGKPVRMIGITLNITERKRLEEELRKGEARFRRMVETNVSGVVVSDSQGRFIEANDAFLKMIGYTREELEHGKISWQMLTPSEYSQTSQHAVQELRETGVRQFYEKEYITKQGKRASALVAVAILESEEDIEQYIVFMVDLTRQKELEKQREHFLRLVSHELRTPLTAINGSLQLAQRRLLRVKQSVAPLTSGSEEAFHKLEETLLQSLRQTHALNRLIDDLVESARITAEKLSLSLQPHNLAEIVRETVEDLRFSVPERNIHLEDMPQEAHVLVDAGRISQVLANLIANALKYSPQEKPVAVGVTLHEQEARVWVRDWGAGLSSEDQQRVWQRYFQGKGAQDRDVKSVNLGLGLHLCRLLIEQQNGRIGVESQLGEGSTFWFTLPLHAVHSR
jgi:PAS domain S-box-containing protein